MEKQKIEFEQIVECGCGLDVHKETVVATIRGKDKREQARSFSTFTSSLTELRDWLKKEGVTHVAMESTGIYWKPVFNILEEDFQLLLVNARHIKNVPGHKTDKSDSAWIAQLLLSGLLKKSFVPPRDIRELRDLFRYKKKLVGQTSSERNRLQKILEDANIKLSSVVSDVFGVSATKMLDAMIDGETNVKKLAKLCHGRLSGKKQQIKEALNGHLTEHHKFMLNIIRKNIHGIESVIEEVERKIEQQSAVHKIHIEQLQSITGVGKATATGIIAEIGADMSIFPNEHHLASWAGMSPGNNESAGKKKRTNHAWKQILENNAGGSRLGSQ